MQHTSGETRKVTAAACCRTIARLIVLRRRSPITVIDEPRERTLTIVARFCRSKNICHTFARLASCRPHSKRARARPLARALVR